MIDRKQDSEILLDVARHFQDAKCLLEQPDTGVGVFKWCVSTNDIKVTDTYRKMTGTSESELRQGLIGLIHHRHRQRAAREIHQALLGGDECFESLYRVRSRSKTHQIFLFRGSILRSDSNPVAIFGMAIDVTGILSLIMKLGKT